MVNTGMLQLHGVSGQRDEAGRLLQLTRIECECLACYSYFTALPNNGLIDLVRDRF